MRALLVLVLAGVAATAAAATFGGSSPAPASGCGVDTSCEAPTYTATTTDSAAFVCNSTLASCVDLGPGSCNQIGTNASNNGEILLGPAGNAACVTRVGQLLGASQVQVVNGPFTCSGACYLQDDNSAVSINDAEGLNIAAQEANTCGASREGDIIRDSDAGGSSGSPTRLCVCVSDGVGTPPTYAWKNIFSGNLGTTTECVP